MRTADEILILRAEGERRLREGVGPVIERFQSEFLNPMIGRVIEIIDRQELRERVNKFFREHAA